MGTWCLHVQGPRGPGDLVLLAQDARSGEHLCLWPQSRGALLCSATAGVTVFTPETPCWFTVQMEVLSRVRGSPTQLCHISLSWAAGKCGRPVCSLLDSVERSLRHSPWLGLGCGDRGCTPPPDNCALPCGKCPDGSVSLRTPCGAGTSLAVSPASSSCFRCPRAVPGHAEVGLGTPWPVLSPKLAQTL